MLLSFTILLGVSGLRYNVGTDYPNYIEYYYIPLKNGTYTFYGLKEYGFLFITKLSIILGDYKYMFFVSAGITLIYIYKAILSEYIKKKYLSFILYVFLLFPISFNNVRQMISVSIILYASKWIFTRKIVFFTLSIILAACFHTSAIIFFPVYFIYNNLMREKTKMKSVVLKIMYICFIIGILLYKQILLMIIKLSWFSKYESYFNAYDGVKANNNEFYLKLLIFCIMIPLVKKMIKKDRKNQLYIFCYIVDLIGSYLGFVNPYLKRITLYYGCYYIFLFPQISEVFSGKGKKLVEILLILYCVLMFIVGFYVIGINEIFPYKFKF